MTIVGEEQTILGPLEKRCGIQEGPKDQEVFHTTSYEVIVNFIIPEQYKKL